MFPPARERNREVIDLTQEEIKILVNILNQVSVSGFDNMNAVLGIVKKLVTEVEDDEADM